MISRRAVLLGAGAACAHAVCVPRAVGAVAAGQVDARGPAGAASAAGPPRAAGQVNPAGVLTVSDVHVADYPTVQALRWMGDMISRESGGELSMRVYHSGQLGRENDTVDLARFGALDLVRINFASLNNTFPATQAMSFS